MIGAAYCFLGNFLAGRGDFLSEAKGYQSGKIANIILYMAALFALEYNFANWQVWVSISAYYILRQIGRGEFVQAQMGLQLRRMDQPWITKILELFGIARGAYSSGVIYDLKMAKKYGFWGNTIIGALRGFCLGILLQNPWMVFCCLQGLAFALAIRVFRNDNRRWEGGEAFNGFVIGLGL